MLVLWGNSAFSQNVSIEIDDDLSEKIENALAPLVDYFESDEFQNKMQRIGDNLEENISIDIDTDEEKLIINDDEIDISGISKACENSADRLSNALQSAVDGFDAYVEKDLPKDVETMKKEIRHMLNSIEKWADDQNKEKDKE